MLRSIEVSSIHSRSVNNHSISISMSAFEVDDDATIIAGMGMGAGGAISQVVADQFAAASSAPTNQLVRALWAVAALTLVADLSVGLYQSPRGPVFGSHKVAYYAVLAAILAVVALEMIAAYWLSTTRSGSGHGSPRLLALGKGLLVVAVVLLHVTLAIGGFALVMVKA